VLWRVLQGAGGAALLSTAQATLRQIFPREEQGMVQAIFILGIIVAPTLGPTLGGWITDRYTWNWCFFINVPIGIVSAFLVATFLQDPPGMQKKIPADWLGISLLMVGLGSLQYVLEEGREKDWFSSALIVRLTIVSAVALATMLWWELSSRNDHPVVHSEPARLLGDADGADAHAGWYRDRGHRHRVRSVVEWRETVGRRARADLSRHRAVRGRDVEAGPSHDVRGRE
jgi:MFS family permease